MVLLVAEEKQDLVVVRVCSGTNSRLRFRSDKLTVGSKQERQAGQTDGRTLSLVVGNGDDSATGRTTDHHAH